MDAGNDIPAVAGERDLTGLIAAQRDCEELYLQGGGARPEEERTPEDS